MWFYTGDHHPPHFHARRGGDWEVRVFIQADKDSMIEIIRPPNAKIKGPDRNALIAKVEAHRGELLTEWEACQPG